MSIPLPLISNSHCRGRPRPVLPRCRYHSGGATVVPRVGLNHCEQLGPFFCAAYGTTEQPNVYCHRRRQPQLQVS